MIALVVTTRIREQAFEPDLIVLWRGVIVDMARQSTARGVVPAGHDAAIYRQADARL